MAEILDPSIIARSGAQGVEDSGKAYQEGMNLRKLAMDRKEDQQGFEDRQAQRQALKQNSDPMTGKLNIPAAVQQVAKQNPMMAMQLHNNLEKYGIEGASNRAQSLQEGFASMNKDNYDTVKQRLSDMGYSDDVKNFPDVYSEGFRNRGLMGSASAAQQLQMLQAQAGRENEIRKVAMEKGIDYQPGQTLMDIYGQGGPNSQGQRPMQKDQSPNKSTLPGANRIPGGEMDQKGLKFATDEMKNRTEGSDFVTAQNNLLAGKNFLSLANKGDPNKLTNQQLALMAGEVGKMAASKAPTESELEHLTPQNRLTAQANWLSKLSGKPVAANQAEFVNDMKEYVGHLMTNSADTMRSHAKQAYDIGIAAGMSPATASRFSAAQENKIKSLSTIKEEAKQEQSGSHPHDNAAVQWAKQNPNDPRAKQIMELNK